MFLAILLYYPTNSFTEMVFSRKTIASYRHLIMSQLYTDVDEQNVPPADKIMATLALTGSEMIFAGIPRQ